MLSTGGKAMVKAGVSAYHARYAAGPLIAGERVLRILPSGLTNWNLVAKVLTHAGVDDAQGIGIQTSHTGYSLIAEDLAIGLIEPFAASAWRNYGVVVRPFHPGVTFDCVIAYSVIQQRTEPLKTFASIIRGIAAV